MDGIVEALSTDLLWVAITLVVLQQILTNADKIGVLLSGRSVGRITKDVPDLLKIKQELGAAGHTNLVKVIHLHIEGVIYPQARRESDRQIQKEIKRYQSWWTRQASAFMLVFYIGALLSSYYVILNITLLIAIKIGDQSAWVEAILGMTLLAVLLAIMFVLNRIYKKILTHFVSRDTDDYEKAKEKWRVANNLPLPNRSQNSGESSN